MPNPATTMMRPASLLVPLAVGFLFGLPRTTAAQGLDHVIDSVMYTDPALPTVKIVKSFPAGLASLWLKALARPENDVKCQAAATIALARRHGMPGLEATIAPLIAVLDQPDQDSTVQLAAAQALIALDARQAAPRLFEHSQKDGIEMRNLVEPALGAWDYQPARARWLERLNQSACPRQSLLLAIRGLGMARELKAVPRLGEMTLSRDTDFSVRVEAARALGAMQTTGLEKDARRLAQEKGPARTTAQLAAALLLRKHRGSEAAAILVDLATEAKPAVAAVALDGLLDDDPRRVLPLVPRLVASPDATVRAKAVEAIQRQPRAAEVPVLAKLLDDVHPQVRVRAREVLTELAQKADLGDIVRREAVQMLASQKWRGLVQATILLTLLDFKPAAPRFVELLHFERPEVFVTAAWGLRKLVVPATLPDQLREIQRQWSRQSRPNESLEMIGLETAQLAESLGQARFAPAAPVLVRFVPRTKLERFPELRAASIWALGLIHEKAAPPRLVQQVIDRLVDVGDGDNPPEDPRVRQMSAIALGRFKAQAAVEPLREIYPGKLSLESLPNACGWALQQIAGEKLPTSDTKTVIQHGWFLEPRY